MIGSNMRRKISIHFLVPKLKQTEYLENFLKFVIFSMVLIYKLLFIAPQPCRHAEVLK